MKTKRSHYLLLTLSLFISSASLFGQRGPQDTWYLDREVKLPVLPHMHKPHGFSIAPNGDIYVPQIDLDNIAVWSPTGEFKFVFGKGGSGTDQLNGPRDCFIYQQEVFVADYYNHRIQVYDMNGSHLRGWGTYGSGEGQFNNPRSIYVHEPSNGSPEVYVSEWNNHRVQVFDLNGSFLRKFGNYGSSLGQLYNGSGICVANDGLVYVSSYYANEIQVFEQNGTAVREIPLGMKAGPIALSGNRLVVTGGDDNMVKIFETNGSLVTTMGTTTASSSPGQFDSSWGVAVDSGGNLHVSCRDNSRIQVFEANGTYLRKYGFYGTGGMQSTDSVLSAENTILLCDTVGDQIFEVDLNGTLLRSFGKNGSGDGEFNNPHSINMDSNGRIYVSDSYNHRIQIFDRNGTHLKSFGSQGSGDAQFQTPWGLTISTENELFVADRYNHRIQVFDLNGTFLRKWGTQGSLDGQLRGPLDIIIDDNGDVVVTDYDNNRIVVFDKSGQFIRKWSINSSAWQLTNLNNGLILLVGNSSSYNTLHLYQSDGTFLKSWNPKPGGASSAVSLANGTIVLANRGTTDSGTDHLEFFRTTYRTIRPEQSKEIPLPEVVEVSQRAGTNYMDITYRINDADSPMVEAAILGFIDGGDDLSKVIIPKTFVGGTTGKLGQNVPTGQNHTVTWNAGADWSVGFGELEMAVLAKDDRDLLNLHFLTLPATDSNSTELKINRSPITNDDLLKVWYWLIASEDANVTHSGSFAHQTQTPLPSGFSPTSLSGLQLWLDAADVDGDNQADTLPNDANVSVWVDKAGGDHNATQSNLSQRPTYKTSQLNGKATIFFDASDDGMATTLNLSRPYTIAVVFNAVNTSNIYRAIQGSNNWLIGPRYSRIGHYTGSWVADNAKAVTPGVYYTAIAINNGTTSKFIVDGKDYTQNASSIGNPGTLYLGKGGASSERLNGHIAEVLAYDRALEFADYSDVGQYLYEKWGVAYKSIFAENSITTELGRNYLFNRMNLRQATTEEITRAREGATHGLVNQFTPTFKIGPNEKPVRVNEYGFDTGSTSGFWVVPKQ